MWFKYIMSLHQVTSKLTPQQANYIPAGKFIYTDETFLIKPPIDSRGEAYPRQGKPLVEYGFSYAHHNPEFIYKAGGKPLDQNFNTLIYNKLTGYT